MSSRLLTDNTWKRLRTLAHTASRATVAVPYFGDLGSRILPLKRGSRLIVNCTEQSVKAGQVHPGELLKLVRRGVEVHTSRNLHAKVFLFGSRVVVGSANVSQRSRELLIEAAIESTERPVVDAARAFLDSLLGDRVGAEYLERLMKLYRPPRIDAKTETSPIESSARVRHAPVLAVGTSTKILPPEAEDAERRGRKEAKARLATPQSSCLEVMWWVGKDGERFTPGTRVLSVEFVGDEPKMVSPLGRVVWVSKFRRSGKSGRVIFLELPKGRRRMSVGRVRKALGRPGRVLSSQLHLRMLKDQELLAGLGRILG